MFHFDVAKLKSKNSLGAGKFGSVCPYQEDSTDMRHVVKSIYAKSFSEFLIFLQEAVLGFNLDGSKGVLPVKAFDCKELDTGGYMIYLLLPRMEKNLDDLIKEYNRKKQLIPEDTILEYFHTLVCGLEYLHSKKISHRDIKPANVLIDYDGRLVLADIGLANFSPDGQSSYMVKDSAGTNAYLAPEIAEPESGLKNKDLPYGDLWSLGIVVIELCLLKKTNINPKQLCKEREALIQKFIDLAKERYSKKVIDVISVLLQMNPAERLTATEIRKKLELIVKESQVSLIIAMWRSSLE